MYLGKNNLLFMKKKKKRRRKGIHCNGNGWDAELDKK
jgi:hypothetical protein